MFAIVSTKNAPVFSGIRRFFALLKGYTLTKQSYKETDFILCELYKSKNERRNIRACARLFSKLKSLNCSKCVFERDFPFHELANQFGINKITAHSIYRQFLPEIINSVCDNCSDIALCIFTNSPEEFKSFANISQSISQIHIITDKSECIFEDMRIKQLKKAEQACHIAAIYSGDELLSSAVVKEHGLILNFSNCALPTTLAKKRTVADNIAFRFGKELIVMLPSGNFNHAEIAQAFLDEDSKCDIKAAGFWSGGRYIGFRTVIRQLSSSL